MPTAASTAATTRTATPTGLPHSAPRMNFPATISTASEASPRITETRHLAARTALGRVGVERIRARVPSRRSSRRLNKPTCAVNNRKNTAIPATVEVVPSSWRTPAVMSVRSASGWPPPEVAAGITVAGSPPEARAVATFNPI